MRTTGFAGGTAGRCVVGAAAGSTGAPSSSSRRRRRGGSSDRDGGVDGSSGERTASHSSGAAGGGAIGKDVVGGDAGSCAACRETGAGSSWREMVLHSGGGATDGCSTGSGVLPSTAGQVVVGGTSHGGVGSGASHGRDSAAGRSSWGARR